MEVNELMSLIGNVGFPVAISAIFTYSLRETNGCPLSFN